MKGSEQNWGWLGKQKRIQITAGLYPAMVRCLAKDEFRLSEICT